MYAIMVASFHELDAQCMCLEGMTGTGTVERRLRKKRGSISLAGS